MDNIPLSKFSDNFIRINQIPAESFGGWLFKPGMLFRDNSLWWGSLKPRNSPHEGIDLQAYKDPFGNTIELDGCIKVPALFPGTIVKVFGDFLGKSIHIAHDIFRQDGRRLNTIFGHTNPIKDLKPNCKINAGDSVATIAVDQHGIVPPHLHVTICWTPKNNIAEINWNSVNDLKVAELLDPMEIICRTSLTD